MEKMGAAMGKIKNPIPKIKNPPPQFNPVRRDATYVKPNLNIDMGLTSINSPSNINKRSDAEEKRLASRLISKNPSPITTNKPISLKEMGIKNYRYPESGAIKMTASPHEYFLGGGMAKGGFNLSKSLAGKVISKAKPILKNVAADFGIDQAL